MPARGLIGLAYGMGPTPGDEDTAADPGFQRPPVPPGAATKDGTPNLAQWLTTTRQDYGLAHEPDAEPAAQVPADAADGGSDASQAVAPAAPRYRQIRRIAPPPGPSGSGQAPSQNTAANSPQEPAPNLTLSTSLSRSSLNLPAPWQDGSGQRIAGPSGQDLQIPLGFNTQDVLAVAKTAPLYDLKGQYRNLAKFRQGGEWDLQRLSGKFDDRYIDSATALIGAYAAGTGMGESDILAIESAYALANSKWPPGTPMSREYPSLPERNVVNTRLGYQLVASGRLKP